MNGAKAYFDMINDAGGVDGRKLRLLAYDDSYDPAKTQICFDRLMEQKVFALGFFVGTPTAVKYLPMAENSKIPLLGLFTGAQTLYTHIPTVVRGATPYPSPIGPPPRRSNLRAHPASSQLNLPSIDAPTGPRLT